MSPCRPGCGACCIAPSITTPMPGMPLGKPAGVACLHLDGTARCRLFGQPQRPGFCASLPPAAEMCRGNRAEAMAWLSQLEDDTRPAG